MPPILLGTLSLVSGQPLTSTLEVDVDGLRNSRGLIQACLTQRRSTFPDCAADPRAILRTVSAGSPRLVFEVVTPGDYAVTLFHDENSNNRLDTLFGIPREGFGFSRNPVVRFGAPRYEKVDIELAPGFSRIHVRVQYIL